MRGNKSRSFSPKVQDLFRQSWDLFREGWGLFREGWGLFRETTDLWKYYSR